MLSMLLTLCGGSHQWITATKGQWTGSDVVLDFGIKNCQTDSWIANDSRCYDIHVMSLRWSISYLVFTVEFDVYSLSVLVLIQAVLSGYWHSPTTSSCNGHHQATYLAVIACQALLMGWSMGGEIVLEYEQWGLFQYKDSVLTVLESHYGDEMLTAFLYSYILICTTVFPMLMREQIYAEIGCCVFDWVNRIMLQWYTKCSQVHICC